MTRTYTIDDRPKIGDRLGGHEFVFSGQDFRITYRLRDNRDSVYLENINAFGQAVDALMDSQGPSVSNKNSILFKVLDLDTTVFYKGATGQNRFDGGGDYNWPETAITNSAEQDIPPALVMLVNALYDFIWIREEQLPKASGFKSLAATKPGMW